MLRLFSFFKLRIRVRSCVPNVCKIKIAVSKQRPKMDVVYNVNENFKQTVTNGNANSVSAAACSVFAFYVTNGTYVVYRSNPFQ